jgi:hypothetical protein
MPLCTNCAQAVPYLYTVYHSVNNARLEQCVRVVLPSLLSSSLTPLRAALMSRARGSLRRARRPRRRARPHPSQTWSLQTPAFQSRDAPQESGGKPPARI